MSILESVEQWIPVKGYEDRYEVSTEGRIRSKDHYIRHSAGGMRLWKGKVLKPLKQNTGYMAIMFGDRTVRLIHRVVAMTFIPNPENKKCVNHKNGNKEDNSVSNLEWATYSENEKHSYTVLKKKPNKTALGKHGKDNPASKPVIQYTKDGVFVREFESATQAAEIIGTSQGRISCACRGDTHTCHGFVFRYKLNSKESRELERDIINKE